MKKKKEKCIPRHSQPTLSITFVKYLIMSQAFSGHCSVSFIRVDRYQASQHADAKELDFVK